MGLLFTVVLNLNCAEIPLCFGDDDDEYDADAGDDNDVEPCDTAVDNLDNSISG